MEKYLRRILNIIDDNKHKMRDGDYIEMCNNLHKIRKINARERSEKCFRTIIKLVKCTIITKIGLKIIIKKAIMKAMQKFLSIIFTNSL